MKPDKTFNYKMTFHVNENHPLYKREDRIISAELALIIMNGLSVVDPTLGYECEVIKGE